VRPGEVGRAGVRVYDIATGALLRSADLPKDQRRHVLNDLAIAADGTAYLTDNQTGEIYRLAPESSALEKVLIGLQLLSPQGILLREAENCLYVADYSIGLIRIDLADGSATALSPIAETSLLGIDGLTGHGQDLIAIQNGVRPHRVLRLTLAPGGRAIEEVAVLESAHREYDEPTLGVVVGDTLFYVANSQWGGLAEDGGVSSGYPKRDPVVLELPL
jgi:sugar lactone lactonase YvrE